MSTSIGNRESDKSTGFRGDRRLVIEDIDDELTVDTECEFGEEDGRREVLIDEGDIVGGVEKERGENQGKGRGRRAGVGFAVLLVLAVCGVGGYLAFGMGGTRSAKVPVNGASGSSNAAVQTEEAMTRQAIEQTGLTGPGVTLGDGSVVRPGIVPPVNGVTPGSNLPVTQVPPVINGDLSSTVRSTPAPATSSNDSSESGDTKQTVARTVVAKVTGKNSERSVSIVEEIKPAVDTRGGGSRGAGTGDGRTDTAGVIQPSFGSMLPVRSLGVLYTLRSGGLVRLELTRDVKGKGWSMARGTILVGAMRGAEFDRAFVSLVGFIDPESGRFVKITGDLLGADGGAGIRGKRRKMTSGWSKALARLGEAGLRIAGTLAGSVGRRPVVITDAFSSYGGRVTGELDGALTGKDKDRDSFVEVAAGSTGYVMITELPDSVQGVDALAKLSGRAVEERSDVDHPRTATGISERELAELIQSGDVEKIKAAYPRMSVEMRRVAEAVVGGDLAGR